MIYGHRPMQMIVLFDLPVKEKEDRKKYSDFHKFLLKDGFIMLQFSVYSRFLPTYDALQTHTQRVQYSCPKSGSVRVLTVTEKQFANMLIVTGKRKYTETVLSNSQLSFF